MNIYETVITFIHFIIFWYKPYFHVKNGTAIIIYLDNCNNFNISESVKALSISKPAKYRFWNIPIRYNGKNGQHLCFIHPACILHNSVTFANLNKVLLLSLRKEHIIHKTYRSMTVHDHNKVVVKVVLI